MKKTTKKLSTLRDSEMKLAVAGSKIVVPVGAPDPGTQVANEPVIPKP
jgi:hypothetical protein